MYYLIEVISSWTEQKLGSILNNISVTSWMSVLLEKTGIPRENHRHAASHWHTLSHNVVSSTPRHERDWTSQLPHDHNHDGPWMNYNHNLIKVTTWSDVCTVKYLRCITRRIHQLIKNQLVLLQPKHSKLVTHFSWQLKKSNY